ncbi:MAG: exodeoxyribonuclease V subunit gamma [Burkholderiales bacterium]|nr:exodeoxyribonuclease V subunit gamma [Burkholderiales bacterium]
MFFQSTVLGSIPEQAGLFELFIAHLQGLNNSDVFKKIQVVVPNQAMANWLKDKIAQKFSICANIDFVVLLGPVIQSIYLANNPGAKLFEFSKVKYIIYQYLCDHKINTPDALLLNNYIYIAGVLDKFRTYQLASQLHDIFQEYLYLRTADLLNLKNAAFPAWQKQILRHIFKTQEHTFLDIYTYFNQSKELTIPNELFIFGLTSVYPSQLQIIKQLATKVNIYWYYQACSYNYYGDLLSNNAKNKLEKKLLKYPDLSLDDLYLIDGNQLLANCGGQSREFLELLQAHDITIYDFKINKDYIAANTMLKIIQEDIRDLKYRIKPEYRLHSNADYYAAPIKLNGAATLPAVYDLPHDQTSIKINSCHNRMREVQVMFNEIANILNNNSDITLNDILICAPDIDNYARYINAVFENEFVEKANGAQVKIRYNITGSRTSYEYKMLETLKLMVNAPYNLKVSYFMEILTQNEIRQSLNFSQADIDLIKQWLIDNSIHFGFDEHDYVKYGYADYSIHSFGQWINNLVLGACLPSAVFNENNQAPLYVSESGAFCPYDNMDSNQIELCNKIIGLINQLKQLRDAFYIDENTYAQLSIQDVYRLISNLNIQFINQDDSLSLVNKFLSTLNETEITTSINLAILNLLLDEFMREIKGKLRFDGTLTCASMQYMRNIPYAYIYILGMNLGEFPRTSAISQINLLAREWHLADRNYNFEDKQTFLDIILAAQQGLYLSYIGRSQTDNSEIKPSSLLTLLMNTLGESFTDFVDSSDSRLTKFDFKNLFEQHSLHPFYNNSQQNFSRLWLDVARQTQLTANLSNTILPLVNSPWDFTKLSPLQLNDEQKATYLRVTIRNLANTFLYSNINLYKILGINIFNDEAEVVDCENLTLANKSLAKAMYYYLEKYYLKISLTDLYNFLATKGILSYGEMGKLQFDYYTKLYQVYIQARGQEIVGLNLAHTLRRAGDTIMLNIDDTLWTQDDCIIIVPPFANIREEPLADKLSDIAYDQKITALIVTAIINNIPESKLKRVVIRQINAQGERRDFAVAVIDTRQLERILAYYIRSLTNPVLIHKAAIEAFVEATKAKFNNGSLKYNILQCLDKARSKYENQFSYNPGLDKIRQDIIFSSIADGYFDYMSTIGGINDIQAIGEILAGLNINTQSI